MYYKADISQIPRPEKFIFRKNVSGKSPRENLTETIHRAERGGPGGEEEGGGINHNSQMKECKRRPKIK